MANSIKLIVFDLDGVLVDSRELHYEALNRALAEINPKYVVTRDEHLARYDGLPTTAKLNMLTSEKGLPNSMHDKIWKLKQDKTFEVINDTFKYDNRLRLILSELKNRGFQLFCASNSIYNTIKLMLLRKGLLEYFDFILSCEDVVHPKPAPDIYISCCLRANIPVESCMVLEDSHVGRKAALMSGCHLLPIEDPDYVTLERILMTADHINMIQAMKVPLKQDKSITVIIPMAAPYEEYIKNGFNYPAPLVEVNGRPMVQMVVENLNISAKYVFVVLREHYEKFHLKFLLEVIAPGCVIIISEKPTEGQAASILLAKEHIDTDTSVIVANCNQYIEWNNEVNFVATCKKTEVDGAIVTFKNGHPRFSYITFDDDGKYVKDIDEKKPVSNTASSGVFYWKKGSELVKYTESIVKQNLRVNGMFYVSSAFKAAVEDGKKIIGVPCNNMWPLNYPRDLEHFYSSIHE